jgi:hypothetical protein
LGRFECRVLSCHKINGVLIPSFSRVCCGALLFVGFHGELVRHVACTSDFDGFRLNVLALIVRVYGPLERDLAMPEMILTLCLYVESDFVVHDSLANLLLISRSDVVSL